MSNCSKGFIYVFASSALLWKSEYLCIKSSVKTHAKDKVVNSHLLRGDVRRTEGCFLFTNTLFCGKAQLLKSILRLILSELWRVKKIRYYFFIIESGLLNRIYFHLQLNTKFVKYRFSDFVGQLKNFTSFCIAMIHDHQCLIFVYTCIANLFAFPAALLN